MSAAEDPRRRSTRLRPHTHASEAGQGVASRRSTPLHPHPHPHARPQIHASDDGDGVTLRRSPRLHPQVNAGDEGKGVARRRSTRLRPHVHTGEEASGVTRRGRSPAALSSPLEDDDLLWEILLRLPPQPSSLPRASAVCKRWRCAVTDPRFHRRFCQHHRKPPLLGFFEESADGIVFKPVLDLPNRIPRRRFHLRLHSICGGSWPGVRLLGCRHGRVLAIDLLLKVLIVIAPITGTLLCVPVPPKLKRNSFITGTVLCAAAHHDHVHGSCHLSPFKVVLLSMSNRGPQPAFAHVYCSETGVWSHLISTPTPPKFYHTDSHASLIGNALYWLCRGGDYILKFDLDGQSLAVIRAPPITNDICYRNGSHQIIQAVDGAVGLAILSHNGHTIQMWQKEINSQSVNKWLLRQTIEMHNIHGLSAQIEGKKAKLIFILGYAEDTDGILLYMDDSVHMVQLKLMQSRKLCEPPQKNHYHSFESFYMPSDCSFLFLIQ